MELLISQSEKLKSCKHQEA